MIGKLRSASRTVRPKTPMPGKTLMALGAAGIFSAGVADRAGPAAAGAMMEAGLGDPEADRYFLGYEPSFRYLAGTMLGGNLGAAMRASAPSDYLRENPYVPTTGAMATGSILGAGLGAAAGVTLAKPVGKMIRSGLNDLSESAADNYPKVSAGASKMVDSMSNMGRGRKAVIGGIAGLLGASTGFSAGLGATGVAPVASYVSNNQEFISQSPYSSSRSTAQRLNASGDIVLGMHNSRRGY
jgi:hypothetical protein